MAWTRALAFLTLLLLAIPALAQQTVNGGLTGAGSAGGGLSVTLPEIGVTSRSLNGVYPSSSSGNGPFGSHECLYDAPTNNPTGYHYLCLDPNSQGGGLLSYGAGGSAAQLPFQFSINGATWAPAPTFSFSTYGGICDGNPANAAINDTAMTSAIAALGQAGSSNTLIFNGPGKCVISGVTYWTIPGALSFQITNGGGLKFPPSSVFATGVQLFKWTGSVTGVRVTGLTVDWNGSTVTVPNPKGPVYTLFEMLNCTHCKVLNNVVTGQPPNNVADILVPVYTDLEIAGNSFIQTGTSIHHAQCINTGSTYPNVSYQLDIHDNVCDGSGIFAGGDSYYQHVHHNTINNLCFGAAIAAEGQSNYSIDFHFVADANVSSWNSVCPSLDDNATRQEQFEVFYPNAVIANNKSYGSPGPCISIAASLTYEGNTCVDPQNLAGGLIYRWSAATGSGHAAGRYLNVAVLGGSGTGATANVYIGSAGDCAATGSVVVLSPGQNYLVGDALTVPASEIGGSGTGCAMTVATINGGDGVYLNHSVPNQGPVSSFGSVVAGSGGTPGTYTVNYSAVTGTGQGAQGVVIVGAGGSVTGTPTITAKGVFYHVGDTLTATVPGLTGFTVAVASVLTWSASGATVRGNTVIEDGVVGHMGYCVGDLFTGGVLTNLGENTCQTPQINVYDFAGQLQFLTPSSNDNRLINPCGLIDQRNAGAATTATASYGPDEWRLGVSLAGQLSFQQYQLGSNQNAGCPYALKVTQTSASGAVVPATYFQHISQTIEVADLQDAQYNSSTPQSYVLSFCELMPSGGQWSVVLQNQVSGYSYATVFRAIAGAVACPQIVIPGDPTHGLGFGTSAAGLRLVLDQGSGQNNCTSTINQWVSGTYYCVTNTNSMTAQAQNANYVVTDLTFTPGYIPAFVSLRTLGDETTRAQRFAQTSFQVGTAPTNNVGVGLGEFIFQAATAGATTLTSNVIRFTTPMRVAPTVTLYNPAVGGAAGACRDETTGADGGAATAVNITATGFQIQCTGATGGVVNDNYGVGWFANASF